MRKNALTSAVIAGVAGLAGVGSIADAVNLNPDGLGQVLIYPYYTTQGGNNTLISVVNTASVGKAVKVRFLEGRNSREVLDFHLYLSRFDVWTGAIATTEEAGIGGTGAGILTTDRSCTVPDIARGGLGFAAGGVVQLADGRYFAPFVNFAYSADFGVSDLGPGGLGRTREGYIEILEMANIERPSTVNTWIEHVNGEPGNCLRVNQAWFGPGNEFIGNPNFNMVAPNGAGQLFGNAMIVNPARGTVAGYGADALEGFSYAILHQPPGDTNPGLDAVNDQGNLLAATANVFRRGQLISAQYDDSVPFGKVDAITALYMSPRVINEFYVEAGATSVVTGTSEWVINFPTKRYYVDQRPALPSPPAANFIPAPRAPFVERFGANGSCMDVSVTIFDREERTATSTGGGFSPRPPGPRPDALCWEVQVVTFNQAANFTAGVGSDILGATYYKNVETNYQNGWAFVQFAGTPALRPATGGINAGVVFQGLPVTGFFVANYDNAAAASGTLANYTSLFRHRTERQCTGGNAPACS